MFSCEFCKISQDIFFTEHLRVTASILPVSLYWFHPVLINLMTKAAPRQEFRGLFFFFYQIPVFFNHLFLIMDFFLFYFINTCFYRIPQVVASGKGLSPNFAQNLNDLTFSWHRSLLQRLICRAKASLPPWKHQKIQKQPPEVFCKKDVLRNFTKFTGKHLPGSLFK